MRHIHIEHEPKRKSPLRIPTAIIISLLMQASVILIWATQLDARVNGVEQHMLGNQGLNERFAKLEERLDDVKQNVGDIKRQLEFLTQNLLEK